MARKCRRLQLPCAVCLRSSDAGEPMQADVRQAWRRGAVALAIPAIGLLALALATSYGAAKRALYDERAAGTVIEVNHTKGGSRPTIEYAVTGQKYQAHTAWPYPQTTFAVGQSVTVRYPSARPSLGMLDSFAELWPLPLLLLTIGLLLLGLAWKARTGLRPLLHVSCGFASLHPWGRAGPDVVFRPLHSRRIRDIRREIGPGQPPRWHAAFLPAGSCRRPGSRWILALVRSCPLPAL